MKGDAPQWALDAAGIRLPVGLYWRRTEHVLTSGTTSAVRGIRIQAGTSYKDQKLVLLHETAHHIRFVTGGPGGGHDAAFWDIAFALYKKHRLGWYGTKREYDYRAGSIAAAVRAGVITRKLGRELKEAAAKRRRRTYFVFNPETGKYDPLP